MGLPVAGDPLVAIDESKLLLFKDWNVDAGEEASDPKSTNPLLLLLLLLLLLFMA
jgi:hypothetical protein